MNRFGYVGWVCVSGPVRDDLVVLCVESNEVAHERVVGIGGRRRGSSLLLLLLLPFLGRRRSSLGCIDHRRSLLLHKLLEHLGDRFQIGLIVLVQAVEARQIFHSVDGQQVEQTGLLAQQLLLVCLEQLHVALLGQRLLCGSVQVGGHARRLARQHFLDFIQVDGARVLIHPLARFALVVRSGVLDDVLLQVVGVDGQLLGVVVVSHLHEHFHGLLQQMTILLFVVALLLDGVEDGLTSEGGVGIEDLLLVVLVALLLQSQNAVRVRLARRQRQEKREQSVSIGTAQRR